MIEIQLQGEHLRELKKEVSSQAQTIAELKVELGELSRQRHAAYVRCDTSHDSRQSLMSWRRLGSMPVSADSKSMSVHKANSGMFMLSPHARRCWQNGAKTSGSRTRVRFALLGIDRSFRKVPSPV